MHKRWIAAAVGVLVALSVVTSAAATPARAVAAARHPAGRASGLAPRASTSSRPAASATAEGTSVAAVSDWYGDKYVVWKGQDANLWYSIYDAATSTWSSAAVAPGMGPLGSQPTVTIDYGTSAAYLFVFWKGTDSNLWMAEATIPNATTPALASSNPWSGPTAVPGMGPLGSAPSATYIYLANIGRLHVFWKGADANLWSADGTVDNTTGQVSFTGPSVVPGMGPLGSAPSAGSDHSSDLYVFWQGSGNGHIWETWYDAATSSWTSSPIDLGGVSGNTGSAPSVAVSGNGQQFVFWQGQDSSLYFDEWTGSDWLNGTWNYVGAGPLGSQPAATLDENGAGIPLSLQVFWKGTDSSLWTTTAAVPALSFSAPTSLGDGPLAGP